MSIDMSAQERINFLSENNLARIATVKPNGAPHVSPVWYLWEKNQLFIAIPRTSVKTRNIRKNNKVAVTIDSTIGPKGVIIEGTAEIEELSEDIELRLIQRYVSPENLDKYVEYAHADLPSVLLKIRPEKIITWDYSKLNRNFL
jgi:PPOX class probable F420-dependent enzyme